MNSTRRSPAVRRALALLGLTLAVHPGAQRANPVDLTIAVFPATPEAPAPPANWAVYDILRNKFGINLKVTLLPGADADTRLAAQAAANNLPDVFVPGRDLFYQLAGQGLLAPTSSLLPLMPTRTRERYADKNMRALATVDGKLHGLQEANIFKNRFGLAIRQDWLTKLGLRAPTTLEEFFAVAKAFTERDPDGNGKNDTYGFGTVGAMYSGFGFGNYGFEPIYGAFGVAGAWNMAPGKFGANVKDPRYRDATAFVRRMIEAKVVDPDWATLRPDDYRARWKQGRYGMFVEDFCTMMCGANYKDFDANNPRGVLSFISPPRGPGGRALGTYAPTGNLFAVSKRALDAGKGPAIARFLEWANTDEGYFLLGFGQRGVNYNLDAKGNVTYGGIDPAKSSLARESGSILQLKWVALKGSPVELRVRYPEFKTARGRTIDPLKFYTLTSRMPMVNVTPTLLIPPAPNQADIERYISENLTQFVLGQKPINDGTWTAFTRGLQGLGFNHYEATARQTLTKAGVLK